MLLLLQVRLSQCELCYCRVTLLLLLLLLEGGCIR